MNDSTNNLSNKTDEAAGKAKEKVGDMTGDDKLKAQGQGDQAESKAKQLADDAKEAMGDVADKVKGMFKK